MKTLLTFLLLLAGAVICSGQTFDYTVEFNADSLYDLQVINVLSADRQQIEVYKNLTAEGLQNRLYAEANETFQNVSALERQIDAQRQKRAQLLAALGSVGLNDFYNNQIAAYDSFFVAPSWTYRNSQDSLKTLTSVYRQGNTTVLRDAPASNWAVIVPRSQDYIFLRLLPAGTLDVNLYSSDRRRYVGTDSEGVRHVLIRQNQ